MRVTDRNCQDTSRKHFGGGGGRKKKKKKVHVQEEGGGGEEKSGRKVRARERERKRPRPSLSSPPPNGVCRRNSPLDGGNERECLLRGEGGKNSGGM